MPSRKLYSPPQLQARTFSQAALFLTGYAWIGNGSAKDLLELMFSQPAQELRRMDSLSEIGAAKARTEDCVP